MPIFVGAQGTALNFKFEIYNYNNVLLLENISIYPTWYGGNTWFLSDYTRIADLSSSNICEGQTISIRNSSAGTSDEIILGAPVNVNIQGTSTGQVPNVTWDAKFGNVSSISGNPTWTVYNSQFTNQLWYTGLGLNPYSDSYQSITIPVGGGLPISGSSDVMHDLLIAPKHIAGFHGVANKDVNGCNRLIRIRLRVKQSIPPLAITQTICEGESVSLNLPSGVNVTWDGGNDPRNPSTINGGVVLAGNYGYTLTQSERCPIHYNLEVNINEHSIQLPVICFEDLPYEFEMTDLILNQSGFGQGNPLYYLYINGIMTYDGYQGISTPYVINSPGIFNFNYIYSNNQCSYNATLNVYGPPIDLGEDITICEGEGNFVPLSIYGQISDLAGVESIVWSSDNGFVISPINSLEESITVSNPGHYTVRVNYKNGCSSQSSIHVTAINCYCESSPSIDYEMEGCTFSFFGPQVSVGGSTMGYLWDFGDDITSTEPNPQHVYQNYGTYYVTLYHYMIGIDGLCCTREGTIPITVEKSCSVDCVIPSFDVITSSNGMQTFTSTSVSSGHIIGYQWTLNGNVVSNEMTTEFAMMVGIDNIVCLTVFSIDAENRCCSEAFCKTFKDGSIGGGPIKSSKLISNGNNKMIGEEVIIYPNPTDGIETLEIENFDINTVYNLIILDAKGNEILKTGISRSTYEFDLSKYDNGTYFIHVIFDDKSIIKKITLVK